MQAQVLVVDDEAPMRSMLKVVLEAHGYGVTTAGSVGEAQAALAQTAIDVVITDMKMETSDAGYAVIAAARNLPQPPPCLILTAFPILARQWRAAGADGILRKPSSISEILRVVSELLRRKKRPRKPA